jgi:hypothetical protein
MYSRRSSGAVPLSEDFTICFGPGGIVSRRGENDNPGVKVYRALNLGSRAVEIGGRGTESALQGGQTFADRIFRQLGEAVQVEFPHDVQPMAIYRRRSDVKLPGDLGRRVALSQ